VGHAGEARHGLAAQPQDLSSYEAWRNREVVGEFSYLYLDGVILRGAGRARCANISVLVAIGIGARVIGRSLASLKAKKRTWRAGVGSCAT